MKKAFIFFLTVVFGFKMFSQNQIEKDNLLKKSFEELSELFYASKPDTLRALVYAKAKYQKAIKERDTIQMLNGKYLLADILVDENIYLSFSDSLIGVTKKNPSKNFPAAIYIDRAVFLFHKRQNSEALNELTNANQIIKKQENAYLKNKILYLMASIQSSVGKTKEALSIYKQVYNYTIKENLLVNDDFFSTLPLNITIEYRNLNEIDSALLYNKKAVNIYKKNKDMVNLGYSYYSLALVYQKKKEYKKALESYLISIPAIQNDENYRILVGTYAKVAKLYDTIGFYNKSLKFHLKADSLFNARKIPSRHLEDTYEFLIQKNNNKDLKKQLLYINKLLEVKEFKLKESNKINKTLNQEYEIPNLLAEKKEITDKLKREVQKSRKNKILFISLLIISLVLIGYQVNKKRVYKKRFLALVSQKKTKEKKENRAQSITQQSDLPEEIVNIIMKGLEDFERHQDYLNPKINLQLLADRLDTNTSYLSKVINQYKKNSFSNYINLLRVDYTINKLKGDVLWRKYTIKAIAEEVGFKKPESFSKAFHKFTGIKPSYFIKELEKER